MSEIEKTAGGWRARKARQTRERIAEVALRLFLTHGFDETTLDAIAEAAAISRRSFFHYYGSKEAILDAIDEGIHEAFRGSLVARPREQKPLEAAHTALREVIERYSGDEAVAIDRLMQSTDALRARKQANYARQEAALFTILCEKWPAPKRQAGLRLISMMAIGVLRIAAERWRESAYKSPLIQELERAFHQLLSEVNHVFVARRYSAEASIRNDADGPPGASDRDEHW